MRTKLDLRQKRHWRLRRSGLPGAGEWPEVVTALAGLRLPGGQGHGAVCWPELFRAVG